MGTSEPVSPKAATAIPSARHWISPTWTGNVGHGAPNSEQMSVPPVIDASCTRDGKELYTYSNEEGGRTEPVDMINLNLDKASDDSDELETSK